MSWVGGGDQKKNRDEDQIKGRAQKDKTAGGKTKDYPEDGSVQKKKPIRKGGGVEEKRNSQKGGVIVTARAAAMQSRETTLEPIATKCSAVTPYPTCSTYGAHAIT
ncbi:hypothetical protein TNIN_198511 [Trichonephila inaurata madagascariensis]|uniref:Uncharacterized protein n=1 Tax=Trichonephila inaurata madagascariensis TaxID=2747483 RepID=A0A8X6YWB9_9ARAC|nr:hypothetical protein TNIN_198511 [Trichonephila inaurata madagascariensis]